MKTNTNTNTHNITLNFDAVYGLFADENVPEWPLLEVWDDHAKVVYVTPYSALEGDATYLPVPTSRSGAALIARLEEDGAADLLDAFFAGDISAYDLGQEWPFDYDAWVSTHTDGAAPGMFCAAGDDVITMDVDRQIIEF